MLRSWGEWQTQTSICVRWIHFFEVRGEMVRSWLKSVHFSGWVVGMGCLQKNSTMTESRTKMRLSSIVKNIELSAIFHKVEIRFNKETSLLGCLEVPFVVLCPYSSHQPVIAPSVRNGSHANTLALLANCYYLTIQSEWAISIFNNSLNLDIFPFHLHSEGLLYYI